MHLTTNDWGEQLKLKFYDRKITIKIIEFFISIIVIYYIHLFSVVLQYRQYSTRNLPTSTNFYNKI